MALLLVFSWLCVPLFSIYLQGGEIVQETITSNVSEDIITLEFQRTDGTLVTELIDFRNVSIEEWASSSKEQEKLLHQLCNIIQNVHGNLNENLAWKCKIPVN